MAGKPIVTSVDIIDVVQITVFVKGIMLDMPMDGGYSWLVHGELACIPAARQPNMQGQISFNLRVETSGTSGPSNSLTTSISLHICVQAKTREHR